MSQRSEMAFPRVTSSPLEPLCCISDAVWSEGGLTKRELLAAMAMQGFISGLYSGNNAGFTVQGTCVAAVEYADALLSALERTAQ